MLLIECVQKFQVCWPAAVLKDSQKEVVIKVLKPGVEDVLVSDLNFLSISSQILEFLNPQLARTSLAGIVADIRQERLPIFEYCIFCGRAFAHLILEAAFLMANTPICQ